MRRFVLAPRTVWHGTRQRRCSQSHVLEAGGTVSRSTQAEHREHRQACRTPRGQRVIPAASASRGVSTSYSLPCEGRGGLGRGCVGS
jgi:hypothetical protein